MFSKILIANRGEIAVRVIKTCRKLGIATVAVASEADRDAPHARMADEMVVIGPPPAAQSYLVIDKILEACRTTGAEAVHPGYGFLSENAGFAKALAEAKIAFIGPNPHAIGAMGDKIESKKLAASARVNTVPGFLGVIETPDAAVKVAEEVGFPVMIKASAGGGGKGMRVAYDADEAREGFARAVGEAKSSFGDDRVFIEKFIEEPRHIEIQVLGDKHGNVVHLNERECSIQRRNQKVIEEAPSPFLDEATRAAMGAQAVALSKAVDYDSAGTVEFIVDKDKNFYFLEMNTRLQVEHPVTELTHGVDLVEEMIRSAAGETLRLKQEDLAPQGWAIELRVYAEDPYRNFLPSIGRLVRYRPPEDGDLGAAVIRNDAGVEEGSQISMFYDPMIAKLCAWAPSRMEAIDGALAALDRFEISGLGCNADFLATVLEQPRFREGRLSTRYIADEFPDGFTGAPIDSARAQRMAAIAAFIHARLTQRARRVTGQTHAEDWSLPEDWAVFLGRDRLEVKLRLVNGEAQATFPDGTLHSVSGSWEPGDRLFDGALDGKPVALQVRTDGVDIEMNRRGARARARVVRPYQADLIAKLPEREPPDTSNMLLCPMPGLLVSLFVEAGQEVEAGQPLAVVEAMKMENVLRSERKGVVASVKAAPGDSLAVDQVILEFA